MGRRITSKAHVTIPVEIREKAGLLPGTEVEFLYDGRTVQIRPARPTRRPSRGEKIVQRLRGTAKRRMSTDEIITLVRGELPCPRVTCESEPPSPASLSLVDLSRKRDR